jgi:hypothetical protein
MLGKARVPRTSSQVEGQMGVLKNVDSSGKRHTTVEVAHRDPFKKFGKRFEAMLGRLGDDPEDCEEIEIEEELSGEELLVHRRMELRGGLTEMERLFLFGKLGGLNDKDAALAAGYSMSVAENTKQKVWKPRVVAEFARVKQALVQELMITFGLQPENRSS